MGSFESLFPDLRLESLVGLIFVTIVFLWIVSYFLERLYVLDANEKFAPSIDCFENPNSVEKVPLPSIFDPPEKYLTLILPAYNEEDRLPSTIQDSLSYLEKRARENPDFTYEILIVDDGSKDNTVKAATKFVKEFGIDTVRVLKQGANYGKGAAVRKGMQCSRGEVILFADSDGATDICDFKKLEDELMKAAVQQIPGMTQHDIIRRENSPKDISIANSLAAAFGSRAHLEEKAAAKRTWYRNYLTKGFHLCVWLVARTNIRDTQCGFKAFTRAAAQRLCVNQRLTRWCFDVELVYLCQRFKIPVKEIQVDWTEIPGSKLRPLSIIHMLMELALIRLGYGLCFWKLRTSFG